MFLIVHSGALAPKRCFWRKFFGAPWKNKVLCTFGRFDPIHWIGSDKRMGVVFPTPRGGKIFNWFLKKNLFLLLFAAECILRINFPKFLRMKLTSFFKEVWVSLSQINLVNHSWLWSTNFYFHTIKFNTSIVIQWKGQKWMFRDVIKR